VLFPDETAFRLFGLDIRWYGLFIMTGVIVATLLANRIAPVKGQDGEHIWGLLPYLVVFGIIGARITYGIARPEQFTNPLELITKFRTGGIAIQGAIVGACLAGAVYCRFKGLRFWRWADIIAPGLSIAQGIGRWGNYANQEEFGGPTTLPWGIAVSPDRLLAKGLPPDVRVHPAFLYEGVADVTVGLVLLVLFTRVMVSRRWHDGNIFATYGILYGITRLVTESLRIDRAYIGPLPGAYWACFAFILLGVVLILANLRRPKPNYGLPGLSSDIETTAASPAALAVASTNGAGAVRVPDIDEGAPPRVTPRTRTHTGYRRAAARPTDVVEDGDKPVKSVVDDD